MKQNDVFLNIFFEALTLNVADSIPAFCHSPFCPPTSSHLSAVDFFLVLLNCVVLIFQYHCLSFACKLPVSFILLLHVPPCIAVNQTPAQKLTINLNLTLTEFGLKKA